MKKIVIRQVILGVKKYFIILAFFIYWFITVLYCSPSNFIKIRVSTLLSNFGILFPQQWTFFAPPPTYNNRLYFSYYDNDSVLLRNVEVIKPIVIKKQENAPFNFRDQQIDYSINSTIIIINNIIVQQKEILQLKYKDSTELYCSQLAQKIINKSVSSYAEIQTLINYSKIILKNSDTLMNDVKFVKITITRIDIPKFENRQLLLMQNNDKQEGIIFTSYLMSLKS